MNLNTRPIGLAVLALLLFLAAAVGLQLWLARETRELQNAAIREQRSRLERALELSDKEPAAWTDNFQRELGTLLGGTVQLYRTNAPLPAPIASASALTFTTAIADAPGWEARATFGAPALNRVQVLHERILVTIVLLALMLVLVPLFVGMIARRGATGESGTRPPWSAAKAQTSGLAELAQLTNQRSVALAEEHAARARAEQDLEVNRDLLGRSVAERVRLGRELHDNICQTLYAVCLTLESVQKKSNLPPEMNARTDQCLTELRRVNQEVRAYLQELEPGRVNGQSFEAALAGLVGSLPTGDGVQIERRIDPAVVEAISAPQVAEIMNILREAVSNSVRHGRARHIVLRAEQDNRSIALSVQDDGVGFAAGGRAGGHGLQNMRARAAELGGQLDVASAPGRGTKVLLTLPLPSAA